MTEQVHFIEYDTGDFEVPFIQYHASLTEQQADEVLAILQKTSEIGGHGPWVGPIHVLTFEELLTELRDTLGDEEDDDEPAADAGIPTVEP